MKYLLIALVSICMLIAGGGINDASAKTFIVKGHDDKPMMEVTVPDSFPDNLGRLNQLQPLISPFSAVGWAQYITDIPDDTDHVIIYCVFWVYEFDTETYTPVCITHCPKSDVEDAIINSWICCDKGTARYDGDFKDYWTQLTNSDLPMKFVEEMKAKYCNKGI